MHDKVSLTKFLNVWIGWLFHDAISKQWFDMPGMALYLQNVQSPSHVPTGQSDEGLHSIFTYINTKRKQVKGVN